jgi:hypothetical protein
LKPGPVHIDDLADPVYPEASRPLRDGLAEYGATLDLSPRALLEAATARTGLTDFGDPSFRERLDVLCRALRTEANLSDTGVAIVVEQLTGNLVNRLRLEALIAEHPGIESIPIERPIIICGLPRSGTTHMHNLIAADPGIRFLPYWESLEPFPAPDDPGDQGRRDRCAIGLQMVDDCMPHFKRMHEMTVDHAHEEIQLLANDISGMLFETTYYIPGFAAHYKAHDQRRSYAYLKRSLQAMQWLRGGTRWVLKSPQHLEQFPALCDIFPDATFVVTHRDPLEITRSMATMVAYGSRMACSHPDPHAIGRHWLGRTEDLLNGCLNDRDCLPAEQSIDIRFTDFLADEQGTVRAVYELAGQIYDDGVRTAMSRFIDDHPRGRHGEVAYSIGDLGLDAGDVARRLSGYRDRFLGSRPRESQ